MKISYRTHPVLEKVKNKQLGSFKYYNCDKDQISVFESWLRVFFQEVALGINNQIYYLSKPFLDAYEAAGDKLFESKLYREIEDDNICFITADQTCLLKIRNRIKQRLVSVEFFDFSKDGILSCAGTMNLDYSTSDQPNTDILGFVSDNVKNAHGNMFNLVLITLFIKYAKVEIKILPPGQKVKDIECNYKNETFTKIIVLDCKWMTTLVKSDGFDVRGHFRLQPKKKDGEWTKEIIWINPFKKEGYTAPARKLAHE
jgi:hypothetical protein